jgi:hypothetical protein
MRRPAPPQPLPTATEIAHAPEFAILIALDTVLEMTTVTIHLALPELDLVDRDRKLLDHDLAVAQDILDLIAALSYAIQLYRDLVLRP